MSGPETSLIKPSGFWQTLVKIFIKSRVDSRKPFIESRVDSRKPFIKSRVDSRKWFIKSRVDSRKSLAKPSRFWRNLLRSRVDSRQTFISQTDSLQVFLLSKVLMSLVYFLSYVGRYPIEVIDGISFRMLVFIPVKVNDGIFFRMLTVFPFVCWSLSQ